MSDTGHTPDTAEIRATIKGILKNIITDNNKFVAGHDSGYLSKFVNQQKPRVTIVSCADSRIHEHALDNTPDSDIFRAS